ncbi:hypothetical protein HA402_011602 [Bradysia odoriphaga]|nr:hypothetical protein HA402_011602 [Bradysia odoriphaga]
MASVTKGDIKSFYAKKNIFVTGATGYLGKVLIEKLLRDCKDVGKMYIMLRANSECDAATKFDKFNKSAIFDIIKKENPSAMDKIHLIVGDMSAKNLKLSDDDVKLLTNDVNVLFHCAASVRFDETLKFAVTLNARGTQQLLELAKKMKSLEAFVHVSTAFSNTNVKNVQEIVYEPIMDYNTIIEASENEGKDIWQSIEKAVRRQFPNTYVFSKNLAEKIVYDARDTVPVTIVRPSLVTPSFKEPYPGWVDSLNGPISICVAAGTGILRTVYGSGSVIPDMLPVDFAVNSFIVAAAFVGRNKCNDCPVYNCTTSSEAPISWNDFLEVGKKAYVEFPSEKILWYPGGKMEPNTVLYLCRFIFLQFIPALFIDLMCIITGKKPWLTKIQRKIFTSLNIISYFLKRQWYWENNNYKSLYENLSPSDKFTFDFDATKIDYLDYVKDWLSGSRKFILKLDDSTLPAARQKLRVMYWIDSVANVGFYAGVAYLIAFVLKKFVMLGGVAHVECNTCTKFELHN